MGKKIKVSRSNNGGEYPSTNIEDFYKDAGIKREFIISYNPQQNEVAKQKNQPL